MPDQILTPAAPPATPMPIEPISPLEAGFSQLDGTFTYQQNASFPPPRGAPPGAQPPNAEDFAYRMRGAGVEPPKAPGAPTPPIAPATPPVAPAAAATADKTGVDILKPDSDGNPSLKERLDFTKVKRTSEDWKQLKQGLDAKDQKIAELQALVGKTPQSVDGDITKLSFDALSKHPEIAKLKQQHDEYLDVVKHLAVERDPEFRAKFDTARDKAMNLIKGSAGAAAADIERILGISDPESRTNALAERIKDFQQGTRDKIIAANAALTTLDVQRDIEIASRKATWDSKQQALLQQQGQHSAQRQASLQKAFDIQAERWQREMPFYQKKDGDAQWNREVSESLDLAREVFSGQMDDSQLATAALWIGVGPRALEVAQAKTQEAEQWKVAYSRLTGVQPTDLGLPPSIPSGSNNAAPTVENFLSQIEALQKGR